MKHLTTLLALLLSCSMLAQGPVEFPWNPDADGDDFIGVNDLMALLGEFDSVFSEEALYLSEDSLSAMYDAGAMDYVECLETCNNLPGSWKMPRLSEVTLSGQMMWLETPEYAYHWHESNSRYHMHVITDGGRIAVRNAGDGSSCFCFTKERPKVEYSYCTASESIQECCASKVAEGWMPLGGMSIANKATQPYHQWAQAFWRWAE